MSRRPLTRSIARPALWVVVGVVLLALPYTVGPYPIHVVDVTLVFAVLAIGLGMALGLAGQINLAQIAFFGIGAYVLAIVTTDAGWGFWAAAVVSLLASVVAGLAVGVPALRVQSHYLGIVTLGLALAFTSWVTNSSVTQGANGISNIPVPPLLGVDLSSEYLYYYLELVVFVAGLAFALFVVRTRLGRRMRAMRDDAIAAGALGADVRVLRLLAFTVSSVYGGVAGILYAGLIRYVSPDSFTISTMFLLLAMVVIGGRQSIVGCVLGAVVLSLAREWLTDFATYAQLGYGLVVVLAVVFAPTGLAGLPARLGLGRRRDGAERGALHDFVPGPATAAAVSDAGPADLQVEGIGKTFRGLRALHEVRLSVPAGAIKGVVGPNGSGKTTLLNVVSGLYTPSTGEYAVGGVRATALGPTALSRHGVARTFQNLRLFADLTVRDNVLFALDRSRSAASAEYLVWPVGVVRDERRLRAEAEELLAEFGIADFADLAPRSLPYGIQRRVELARAVATGPRILLLDEPAAGLNGQEVAQLAQIVRTIRDRGVTVVLVEHNMGLVMSLCDEVAVLANGSVIADGTPEQVVADPAVVEAYLGDSSQLRDLVPDQRTIREAAGDDAEEVRA
ncbi:ATP-binding cassette domain-containing protein [Nocardioides mangrovicus]|uniref:ATP-binding cassette domain-containing protein n=1 Tax=Nocardioides mangrovicus TaxID=2478913 RepID=A0A3L8P5A3_9ACTN|nr:branched-chain amino acid ABC transporter ATP-binding protein/permease [Nocardioides mangrovicus]RLV50361.1 ATP-binding cassette domain-containing protein [Nocardioides mangrovicus]